MSKLSYLVRFLVIGTLLLVWFGMSGVRAQSAPAQKGSITALYAAGGRRPVPVTDGEFQTASGSGKPNRPAIAVSGTPEQVAGALQQVIDETGLTGIYDITLRMPASVEQSPRNGGTDDERPAAWIAAVEHAGFKFVSKKAPLKVVVVDHIDPPTPN